MVFVEASKGHASNEAAPQMSSQKVRDSTVSNQQEHHNCKQRLVFVGKFLPFDLRDFWQDDIVDEIWPELDRSNHGYKHKRNADDWKNDHWNKFEVPLKTKQNIEQDQGENVVNK